MTALTATLFYILIILFIIVLIKQRDSYKARIEKYETDLQEANKWFRFWKEESQRSHSKMELYKTEAKIRGNYILKHIWKNNGVHSSTPIRLQELRSNYSQSAEYGREL